MSETTAAPPNARTLEVTLLVAAVLTSASNSIVFALMANLQDEHGLSSLGVGAMVASGFVASLLVQLLVSPLADRGHVRRLLVAGTALSAAGNLVFAFGDDLSTLIAARVMVGAAAGMFSPSARAVLAGMSPTGVSARLGRMASAELAGFVLGPVVGGALVGPLGLRWPFAIFACSALLSMAVVSRRALPELARSEASGRPAIGLLRVRAIVVAVLISGSLRFPFGMYESTWDRYLTDLGGSDTLVGISIAAYAIPFITMASLGGRLAEGRDPMKVALAGIAVVAPLTIIYGQVGRVWPVLVLGVAEACAQALATPAAQANIARVAPVGRAAAAQGLAGASDMAVAAGVSFLSAWGYGHFGPKWMFGATGLGVLALAGLALAIRGRRVDATAAAKA